jgi:hypothetical protein
MNVKRFAPLLVLLSSAALGYLITNRACLDYDEPSPPAQTVAAFDDTCSAASPSAVTCEMPGEISRADYLRLVVPKSGSVPHPDQTKQELAD